MLLCQHNLHMKLTTSLCSVIQQSQVHQIFIFYVFYCNLKKDHIRRNINRKKKEMYICEISIIIILICLKLGPYNKKLSCLRLMTANYAHEILHISIIV